VENLKVQLKELESMMEESEQWASRKRKANKELEEELLVYKQEAMEHHEKCFNKAIRQVGFFVKELEWGFLTHSRM